MTRETSPRFAGIGGHHSHQAGTVEWLEDYGSCRVTSGEKIVYMCLAGLRYDAWVRIVRPDGTVDLASDVGSRDLHELSRIEAVPPDQLRPGTCCEVSPEQ